MHFRVALSARQAEFSKSSQNIKQPLQFVPTYTYVVLICGKLLGTLHLQLCSGYYTVMYWRPARFKFEFALKLTFDSVLQPPIPCVTSVILNWYVLFYIHIYIYLENKRAGRRDWGSFLHKLQAAWSWTPPLSLWCHVDLSVSISDVIRTSPIDSV